MLLVCGLAWVSAPAWGAVTAPALPQWYQMDSLGGVTVDLYFFWSQSCRHCRRARPDIERLAAGTPWLRLHSLEVSRDRDNAALYRRMAASVGQEAVSVPAFLFCGSMLVGYDDAGETGRYLQRRLQRCHDALAAGHGLPSAATGASPQRLLADAGLDRFDPQRLSLPLTTVVIAGLDAFNPCAFFVLLFLLSLLVHAGGRGRMLLVGGVFVTISGLVYFALMAAWLNVFLLTGHLPWVTAAAGAVAVVMALFNIKDFALPGRGPSLSIAQGDKPRIYQRVRGLLNAEHLGTMLAATAVLAVAANSYELLCTAGFPMLYTRLLTLEHLSTFAYYAYLALYNVIYVVPLFVIVTLFTYTLGARRMQPQEGRLLKLLSGAMMLGLGLTLLFAPERLADIKVAAGIVLGALVLTLLARWWLRRRGDGSLR